MKAFITGGTGFIGKALTHFLSSHGYEVTILTRGKKGGVPFKNGIRLILGDPLCKGAWQEEVPEHDILINLSGASIFGLWTRKKKMEIKESRLLTTRNLVDSIPEGKGMILFSASAVGYYGFHEDEEIDESSGPGDDFLAQLARQWEEEAMNAKQKGTRVIIMRFGVVLGQSGGALGKMLIPFRFFVGGPIGSGLQWISWIHIDDLVSAFFHILKIPEFSGPVNFTTPFPIRNRELAKSIGKAIRRPSFIPIPSFCVRIFLGEFGSFILKGQRVLPRRLLNSGFLFKYPDIEGALRNLLYKK
jgi:uncharacterized protein (TIGR01777 family)